MHIHNVEEYLKEAIESIIKQDLSFKDNVQLIIVYSDSVDDSARIAQDYQ